MDHIVHPMKKVEDWKEYAYGGNGMGDTSALHYLDAVQEITEFTGDLLAKCHTFEELKAELLHFHQERTAFIEYAQRNIPGE